MPFTTVFNKLTNIFKSNEVIKDVIKTSDLKTSEQKLPASLTAVYKPNYDTFDTWLKRNRNHQTKAIDATKKADIGQISLPTGTGKTHVQIALHVAKMIEMTKNNQYGVFVIGAHRLALCSQLLTEMIDVVVNAGLPFDILFIGSHRFADDTVHCDYRKKGLNAHIMEATSTTQGQEVIEAVQKAHARNRHVIAVSTYHSFDKLDRLHEITQCTYDEAHTLIGENFFDNIKIVRPKIKYNYFFTATRRVQGEIGGMNNTDVFGEVLYEEAPRRMIEDGEIVPPKFHIITPDRQGDYDNFRMLINTVISGFEQHKHKVKYPYSKFPDKSVDLGAKLLISTTGNLEMLNIHNSPIFQNYCLDNNIKVFLFSSQEGYFSDFIKTDRTKLMKEMKNMADTDDAILMHIDILTEGIDLPSITGVMPFRELNKIKLLQTIGRGTRLLPEDRTALYSGEIKPMEWDRYVKPCVWLILPTFFRSLGDHTLNRKMLQDLINTYEIPVEEYTNIDVYLATEEPELERITDRDNPNRRDRETGLIHKPEEIFKEDIKIFDDIGSFVEKYGINDIRNAVQTVFGSKK